MYSNNVDDSGGQYMDIVILDGYTINPGDLSWEPLENLCDRLTVYDSTPMDMALERAGSAEVRGFQPPGA